MDDTLIPLGHGYALVQVVLGAGRSVFLAFALRGQSLGRFGASTRALPISSGHWACGRCASCRASSASGWKRRRRRSSRLRAHGRLAHRCALEPMLNPVSEFAIRAGEKLRAGRAWQALVFAHTSPFRPGKSYSKAISLALRRPNSNTLDRPSAR